MRRNIVIGLVCVMLLSTVFTGCGKSSGSELDETSIYIRKDGSVASAVYEPFDTEVYSKDDLQVFVEDVVKAYNQGQAGVSEAYVDDTDESLLVAIDSLKVEGDDAVLKLEYASCSDYVQFNENEESIVQLASGTISGAADSGIDLSQFELVDEDGTAVSSEEVDTDYYVVFVEGMATIIVEGTIQYTTENVQIEENDTAFVFSSGELACIVFK